MAFPWHIIWPRTHAQLCKALFLPLLVHSHPLSGDIMPTVNTLHSLSLEMLYLSIAAFNDL